MRAADVSTRPVAAAAHYNRRIDTMAKLKTAILRAQETADIIGANESLLWQARDALSDAINNPEPDEGLASAERALALINTYLMEAELCKQIKIDGTTYKVKFDRDPLELAKLGAQTVQAKETERYPEISGLDGRRYVNGRLHPPV
jgi:hypothetical protein